MEGDAVGKPSTLSRHQREERRLYAGQLLKAGKLSPAEIAREVGVIRAAVCPWAKHLKGHRNRLPALKAHGIDLVWFGVVMTILMEMGLIHPPVGLNLFVINSIAPDIKLSDIIWGTLPFIGLMVLAIFLLAVFPEIAMWLPHNVK